MKRLLLGLCWALLATRALALGGDFSLTDQHGRAFQLAEHRDKVVLLFFGYTHCPDICPDTLGTIGQALAGLPDSRGVQVVMVTVDPARDTPAHLARYLAYFDERYIGLSGSWREIKDVAELWAARFSTPEHPADPHYFVDHSADIVVIERGGKVHGVVPYGLPAEHLGRVVQGALAQPAIERAPVAGLLDLQGQVVDPLAAGKPVLLHYWASWCGPCRAEFADLQQAKPLVAALDASFYAVNLGDSPDGIARFLRDYPLDYPMLRDTGGLGGERWSVKRLPQTVLLGPDGSLQQRYLGAQPWAEPAFVEQLQRDILRASSR